MLATDRHWQPNVLGNRSPLADPTLTGGTAGVSMRDDVDDLARWYLAALQALAYATRHIVDALRDAGRTVELLIACGGSAGERLVAADPRRRARDTRCHTRGARRGAARRGHARRDRRRGAPSSKRRWLR